jgi:hypothetical protein
MKINDSHLIEGYRQVAHGQVQRPDKEAKESALQQTRTAADDVDLSSRARQYQKMKSRQLLCCHNQTSFAIPGYN